MPKILSRYLRVLRNSIFSVLNSWRLLLLQIPLFITYGLCSIIFRNFGLVGSLLLGLASVLLIAYYLTLVKYAVNDYKFNFEDIKQEGLVLFSPLLSVFFSLWLIQIALFIIGIPFLKISVGILICVLLNPIIEFVYLDPSDVRELIESSYNFVTENFVIWFLPIFIFLSPLILTRLELMPFLFSNDPISLLRSLFSYVGFLYSSPLVGLKVIPIVYILFFVLIFRGKLLKTLTRI